MMTYLDEIVSQAVYATKFFERALHDEGPWEMSWGPFVVSADREITDDCIIFSAVFSGTWPGDDVFILLPDQRMLLCRGEVVKVAQAEVTRLWRDADLVVEWVLRAKVTESNMFG